MVRKWKFKAFAVLTMAVCARGCAVVPNADAGYEQFLQAQMQWNASKKAELGISDSVSSKTSVTDRRSIFAGPYTEGFLY
jgi:hypothetical protein